MTRQITVVLLFILGCSQSLSWEITSRDRVDSLNVVRHGDDRLDVYIECDRGIGSVTLDFEDVILVDSIRITLMYDSLQQYGFCESLGFQFTGNGDSNIWMVNHSMIDLGEDGTASFTSEDGFITLGISWIDFYRQ